MIQDIKEFFKNEEHNFGKVAMKKVVWLIVRVEELEEKAYNYDLIKRTHIGQHYPCEMEMIKAGQQAKRITELEEALRYYASEEIYSAIHGVPLVLGNDFGMKARKALEEDS